VVPNAPSCSDVIMDTILYRSSRPNLSPASPTATEGELLSSTADGLAVGKEGTMPCLVLPIVVSPPLASAILNIYGTMLMHNTVQHITTYRSGSSLNEVQLVLEQLRAVEHTYEAVDEGEDAARIGAGSRTLPG